MSYNIRGLGHANVGYCDGCKIRKQAKREEERKKPEEQQRYQTFDGLRIGPPYPWLNNPLKRSKAAEIRARQAWQNNIANRPVPPPIVPVRNYMEHDVVAALPGLPSPIIQQLPATGFWYRYRNRERVMRIRTMIAMGFVPFFLPCMIGLLLYLLAQPGVLTVVRWVGCLSLLLWNIVFIPQIVFGGACLLLGLSILKW